MSNSLNSKVILKYVLIHLAELVVLIIALFLFRHFFGISTWLLVTILVLWIIKDIILFPKVWRAYAFGDNNPLRKLIGMDATAMNGLNPAGYVRVNGELWRAEVKDPLHPANKGDRARVVDIRESTLIVESLPQQSTGDTAGSKAR